MPEIDDVHQVNSASKKNKKSKQPERPEKRNVFSSPEDEPEHGGGNGKIGRPNSYIGSNINPTIWIGPCLRIKNV